MIRAGIDMEAPGVDMGTRAGTWERGRGRGVAWWGRGNAGVDMGTRASRPRAMSR